jgi:polyisoprenoid-binding protein YceI
MTSSTPTPSPRRGPLLAIAGIALVVLAAAGLWYVFLRPSGPAPVAIGTTPSAAATATPAASAAAESAVPAGSPAASEEASAPGGEGGIAGLWTTDPSVGSFDDFSSSFVGYRVREELASIGATEAVGRTPDVSGSMRVDGTTITAAEFTADLTTLRSDESNRDRQLGRQALETSRFPTATFVLTEPVDLGTVPAEGQTVDVTVTGELTLHGVTRSVEVPLQAKLEGGVVTVVGSLPIRFADYDIEKPSSFVVLSVEDNGVMELQLRLTPGLG